MPSAGPYLYVALRILQNLILFLLVFIIFKVTNTIIVVLPSTLNVIQVPTLVNLYKRKNSDGYAGLSGSVGMAFLLLKEIMCMHPCSVKRHPNFFALFRVARFLLAHPFLLDTSRSGDSRRSSGRL